MPNIAAMYDGGTTTDSSAGEANPSATPAPETLSAPAGELTTTSLPPGTAAPQIAAEDTGGTLTPLEKSIKQDNWGSKVYHGVLNALGGGGDVSYTRDKDGKMVVTPVATGAGTQWKKIIAGGLSGFAASAQAGGTGPGSGMRAAGAGINAGLKLGSGMEQSKRDRADQDYDAAQRGAVQNAQLALLSHQITKSTFDLGRDQVNASVEDSDRETNFEKVIADGGSGSTDMGVFPDFQSVIKAFKEAPELHDHQAGGRIISIPHINGKGMVDGIRAALVSPDWLTTKVNRELPITTRTYKDGKVEEQTFTIPAGSLTGLQYTQMVQAQSKDSLEELTKVSDAKARTSEADTRAKLEPSESAKNYADAAEAKSKALLADAQAAAEAAGGDVDWGPGGEKGFNSWHKDTVTPALQAERTYRLASNVYNEYQALRKQGKDFATGAQSVQMLSYHMANTFGNVKGARITKDLITKHMGARSISDSAEVAVNKLINGEQLSAKQWDAYFSMVGQNRNETWRGVLDDAEALHRPLDYIAFPQDLRSRWEIGQGRVSLDKQAGGAAAGSLPDAAMQSLRSANGGAVTFANGQTWKLDLQGQPVQVK